MIWKINKSKPICPQLAEQISAAIACGAFKPNEKLSSVREIAVEAGVNPNTVQKTFELLEGEGLVYSVRGTGWFVSDNAEVSEKWKKEATKDNVERFFAQMRSIGYTDPEIKKIVEEYEHE